MSEEKPENSLEDYTSEVIRGPPYLAQNTRAGVITFAFYLCQIVFFAIYLFLFFLSLQSRILFSLLV